ncbi:hypothetical protein ACWGIA_16810 [Streptomyces bobili]
MVDIPKGYGPDDELDPEAADPLYLQLAAVLISRIQSGVYPLGRSLPGVDQLMQEFGLARGTGPQDARSPGRARLCPNGRRQHHAV